jgi:hypothetical protein
MKFKKIFLSWKYWQRFFLTLGAILTLVQIHSVITSLNQTNIQLKYAAEQISNEKDAEAGNMMITFNNLINTGTNNDISNVIDSKEKLLQQNGGKFTTHDLDSYLGIFESLEDIREKNLISEDILFDNFSSAVEDAYNNPEIVNYLKTIRKQNSSYFLGFDELANHFFKEDN